MCLLSHYFISINIFDVPNIYRASYIVIQSNVNKLECKSSKLSLQRKYNFQHTAFMLYQSKHRQKKLQHFSYKTILRNIETCYMLYILRVFFSFYNYCNIQNVNSKENLFIFICIFYCMSGRILFSE